MTLLFYFRTIINNDNSWSNELLPNSDNMQLAHPEPRQVAKCADDNSISSNLPNDVLEKYDVFKLFSIFLENDQLHLKFKYNIYIYILIYFLFLYIYKWKQFI